MEGMINVKDANRPKKRRSIVNVTEDSNANNESTGLDIVCSVADCCSSHRNPKKPIHFIRSENSNNHHTHQPERGFINYQRTYVEKSELTNSFKNHPPERNISVKHNEGNLHFNRNQNASLDPSYQSPSSVQGPKIVCGNRGPAAGCSSAIFDSNSAVTFNSQFCQSATSVDPTYRPDSIIHSAIVHACAQLQPSELRPPLEPPVHCFTLLEQIIATLFQTISFSHSSQRNFPVSSHITGSLP
jgi:hypothetical protein